MATELEQLLRWAPRATGQTIGASIHGHIDKFPKELRGALRAYHDDRPWTREDFAGFLKEHPDPRARTALVYLWGGGQERHARASVEKPPRGDISELERFGSLAEPNLLANRLLWEHGRSRVPAYDRLLPDPYVAFDKLWDPGRRSDGLLNGVGVAFGTKILYWAERVAVGFGEWADVSIPLIYDSYVSGNLNRLPVTYVADDHPDGSAFPRTDRYGAMPYTAYASYCRLAHRWAQHANELDLDVAPFLPDDVEVWLFRALLPDPGEADTRSDAGGLSGGPEDESDGTPVQSADEDEWDRARLGRLVQALANQIDSVTYTSDVAGDDYFVGDSR